MESLSKKDKDLVKKITEKKCNEWAANPLVNPITNAKITHKGPTYNIFESVCKDKFNIQIDETSMANTLAEVQANTTDANLPKLPKEIDGISMPQTTNQWNKNELIKEFKKIILLIENPKIKLLSMYAYENFASYIKICELGLEYHIVPDDKITDVNNYIEKFNYYSIETNLPSKLIIIEKKYIDENEINTTHIFSKEYLISTYIDSIQLRLLNGNLALTNADEKLYDIMQKIASLNYYRLIRDRDLNGKLANWGSTNNILTNSRSYINMITSFKNLNDFIDELKELDNEKNKAQSVVKTNSSSAKLPPSISRSMRIRQIRIPPQHAEEIDSEGNKRMRRTMGPDYVKELVTYSEKVKTSRSKFRHHELMSQMTPLDRESLEPLSDKTRVQLLEELKMLCNEMKDSITGKRFDRMSKKNLHLIVQLGPSNKKRCYYVRNIYKYWESIAESNIAFRDPETRIAVNDEEKQDIMKKIQYLKKDALNPEKKTRSKDPKLELVINIDSTNTFYTFNVKRKIGTLIYTIYNLGVLPAHIDLHSENAYYTSEATVANIKEAFDKGRIMTSNFIPYTCCRMHFKKQPYWEGTDEEIKHKFKLFADEAYGLL